MDGDSPSVSVTRATLTISRKVNFRPFCHKKLIEDLYLTDSLSSSASPAISADIISTVEFDHTGDYLATGDKGGRVVLFERNQTVRLLCFPYMTPQLSWPVSYWTIRSQALQKKGCEYKFYTEFQSHEPEFDYLKSLEIEEKINQIKWCPRQNSAHFILSTNGQC